MTLTDCQERYAYYMHKCSTIKYLSNVYQFSHKEWIKTVTMIVIKIQSMHMHTIELFPRN